MSPRVGRPSPFPPAALAPALWATKKAAERWIAKKPPEPYRDMIRVWGLLTHRPPGQTSWSRALVRRGTDPGKALAGVGAEDIRVRGCGE